VLHQEVVGEELPLIVLGLGFLAICLDTVCGVLFAKLMNIMSGGKINPLIGAAGISAFPMAVSGGPDRDSPVGELAMMGLRGVER